MERIIVSRADQQRMIIDTTSLRGYSAFVNTNFRDIHMLSLVARTYDHADPDYYRLLAAHGVEAAQLGFDSLEGHLIRHGNHKWKKEKTTPEHIAASLVYMADMNVKAAKVKQPYIDEVATNPTEEAEIWSKRLRMEKGVILTPADRLATAAQDRIDPPQLPLFPPNLALSADLLARLPTFNGDYADGMEQEEFEEVIFPKIKKAYNSQEGLEHPIFSTAQI